MKQQGIFIVQLFGGWLMAIWPVWVNSLGTWIGLLSSVIGILVLLFTLRTKFIGYKIKRIEWRKKIKDIEVQELKDLLRIIEKEKDKNN